MENPYEVLGVDKDASQSEIKKAYFVRVRELHPDQFSDNPLQHLAEERLKQVNAAFEQLKKDFSQDKGQGIKPENKTEPDHSSAPTERTWRVYRTPEQVWQTIIGSMAVSTSTDTVKPYNHHASESKKKPKKELFDSDVGTYLFGLGALIGGVFLFIPVSLVTGSRDFLLTLIISALIGGIIPFIARFIHSKF
jgi:preprotein translocase subunit Sec63